jgi:hypothetical protein
MNRYLTILIIFLLSAACLRADDLGTIERKQKKVAQEIHQLEQLLSESSPVAKRVYRHTGKTYTILGKDSSGLFCKVSPGKTKLLKWKELPSQILAAYRPSLARERLEQLQSQSAKLNEEYVFAEQQIRKGLVFSGGAWIKTNTEPAVADTAEILEDTGWTAGTNGFSVFDVRFGMTPLEVMAVWPEAKPAKTSDGYTTLEYRHETEDILLSSFLSEDRKVIMIMVAFDDLTTIKRDSIVEALDEKYSRARTEEDKKDPYSATYIYYPDESIILVAKTRRTDMGHIVVCTYGHIDKYKENEAQQKKIMKKALKTLL